MKQTKHTPGPWNFHERTRAIDKGVFYLVVGEGSDTSRRVICETPIIEKHTDHKANARLIAESPSMYKYIKEKAEQGDGVAETIINKINA